MKGKKQNNKENLNVNKPKPIFTGKGPLADSPPSKNSALSQRKYASILSSPSEKIG